MGRDGNTSPNGMDFAAWSFGTARVSSSSRNRGGRSRAIFQRSSARIAALPDERFVLDGELIIQVDGILSFDALQMRLHPAESRVRKLAAATPAKLMLFDCLAISGEEPDRSAARRAASGAGRFPCGGRRRGYAALTLYRRALGRLVLARAGRRRAGRRDRQKARRTLSARRAGDAQGQADADRRLRRGRLPLRRDRRDGRIAAARSL